MIISFAHFIFNFSMFPSSSVDTSSHLAKRRERRARKRGELIQFIVNSVQGVSIGISALYYYFFTADLPPSSSLFSYFYNIFWFTTALCFFFLWLSARFQLGLHLTLEAKVTHSLVTTGLYAHFRHPIYYFGSAAMVCYIMLIQWFSLLWLVVLLILPIQAVRAKREQLILRKAFEDEYDCYVKSVLF
jgi:protein-S-isoprenylcysteine O-methyltransferase Ste14